MSKLTRNNIAYDLTISPYKFNIMYSSEKVIHDVEYVFSSEYYKKKFMQQYGKNRETINSSLSNRFKFDVKNNLLCDLVLYSKIEKRGFLIICNGVSVECPENITLDGKNPIIRI